MVLGLMAILVAMPFLAAGAATPSREEPVDYLPQWNNFATRQSRSLAVLDQCRQNPEQCRSQDVRRWAALVDSLEEQNRLRQIITVNKWFNRLPYKHDEYAHGPLDHWADMVEFLERRGDCEDYALSKYYTLRTLGFSPEQLRIVVVYDSVNYLNHAVVMVHINGTRYLLDINADDTSPSSLYSRYKPIYAFNEHKAWFY